jgi:hypothetical protein
VSERREVSSAVEKGKPKRVHLGVGGSKDVESVSVVGSDDDEGVLILSDVLQVLKSSANGGVELEELAESAVVVGDMHLWVCK